MLLLSYYCVVIELLLCLSRYATDTPCTSHSAHCAFSMFIGSEFYSRPYFYEYLVGDTISAFLQKRTCPFVLFFANLLKISDVYPEKDIEHVLFFFRLMTPTRRPSMGVALALSDGVPSSFDSAGTRHRCYIPCSSGRHYHFVSWQRIPSAPMFWDRLLGAPCGMPLLHAISIFLLSREHEGLP